MNFSLGDSNIEIIAPKRENLTNTNSTKALASSAPQVRKTTKSNSDLEEILVVSKS